MKEHVSVLLEESIRALNIKEDGSYLDGTYGRGGHAAGILEQLSPKGHVFACDCDPDAAASAANCSDNRLKFYHVTFADVIDKLKSDHITSIDGVMLDLGVSSPQFDNANRGFSFRFEAPVDMRMDQSQGVPAHQWLYDASEEAIADVIFYYGEERYARRIARVIKERCRPNMTTMELANCVITACPKRRYERHPATKTFQAIRMHINQELQQLDRFLDRIPQLLSVGGRVVVITFHGLERKMLKQHFQPSQTVPFPRLRPAGRVIKPSPLEVRQNARASSALLTTLEKVA